MSSCRVVFAGIAPLLLPRHTNNRISSLFRNQKQMKIIKLPLGKLFQATHFLDALFV